jgi:hypothetical protein
MDHLGRSFVLMAKRHRLLSFPFYGLKWMVYVVPNNSPHLKLDGIKQRRSGDGCWGMSVFDDREIYLNAELTEEGRRVILCHEVEHVVEEWIPFDHRSGASTEAGSDCLTDLISKGWLYLIRHAPELMRYLCHQEPR